MKLPKPYFTRLAKSDIVVLKGRVYQLRPGRGFILDGKEYALSESETLKNLEALYLQDFEMQIDIFQTKNTKKYFKKNLKNKSLTLNKIRRKMAENNCLLLIFEKIIPAISGERIFQDKFYEDIDEKEIRKYASIDDYQEAVEFKKLKRKYEARCVILKKRKILDKSLLGRYILSGLDVITKKGAVYAIKNGKTGARLFQDLQALERRYIDLLKPFLLTEGLKTIYLRDKDLRKLSEQQAMLARMQDKFNGKNGGFYKDGEDKFVFWMKYPKFINKCPEDGKYRLFDAGKVMLRSRFDGRDFEISGRLWVDAKSHVHNFVNDDGEICIGGYESHKNKGWERIIDYLFVARQTIMSSINDKKRNIQNQYGLFNIKNARVISEREALKSGIPITNINIETNKWKRRKR